MRSKSGYFRSEGAVNHARIQVSREASKQWRAARWRTDHAARVVIVEHAERNGRKNAREVEEERRRYGLVQGIGADEPCARIQVDSQVAIYEQPTRSHARQLWW